MTKKISTSDLCLKFLDYATEDGAWAGHLNIGNFDIIMVRLSDGAQVGIQARLNLKSSGLCKALPQHLNLNYGCDGPDYRAVLVPDGCSMQLSKIAETIGLTVIQLDMMGRLGRNMRFWPALPSPQDDRRPSFRWHEWGSLRRCPLPDYIAPKKLNGVSIPKLTDWQIKAIKMAILLEHRPVTREDFKHLQLDPQRWTAPWPGWLKYSPRGYVPFNLPDFKTMYRQNWDQIAANKAQWMLTIPV